MVVPGAHLAGGAPREGVVVEQIAIVGAEDRTAAIESLASAGTQLMGGLAELWRERGGEARRAISVNLFREQLGVEALGIETRHRNALMPPFRPDPVAIDGCHQAQSPAFSNQTRASHPVERDVEKRRGRALGFPGRADARSSCQLAVRQGRVGLVVGHKDLHVADCELWPEPNAGSCWDEPRLVWREAARLLLGIREFNVSIQPLRVSGKLQTRMTSPWAVDRRAADLCRRFNMEERKAVAEERVDL